MKRLTLIITALIFISGQVYAQGWQLQISAEIDSITTDTQNFAGVDSTATDGFDVGLDIPEPPPLPYEYISLYFPHPEWEHPLGPNFTQDLRTDIDLSDANIPWYFEVETDKAGSIVILEFLNLASVPGALRVILRDLDADITQDIRATSVYNYTAPAVGHFELAVGDSTPPSVTVLFPNGGEMFRGGAPDSILWLASDGSGLDNFQLSYSVDAGSTYTAIDEVPGDQTGYLWNVPLVTSDQARILVRATDVMGNYAEDESDSLFIIDAQPPSVTTTYPNGGEILTGGTIDTVTWTASDNFGLSEFVLYRSLDSGSTWVSIDTVSGDQRSYAWNVPSVTTDQALISIDAIDLVGITLGDMSDATFTIITGEQFHTFYAGWNMISVPLEPYVTAVDSVIGDDVVPPNYYYLYGYSPIWGYYSPAEVYNVRGYWLATVDSVEADVQGTAVGGTREFLLQSHGWHLLGDPFLGSVPIASIEVDSSGLRLPFEDALAAGWIGADLFTFVAGDTGYNMIGSAGAVDSWFGYWFRTLCDSLGVIIPPPPLAKAAARQMQTIATVVTSSDWRIALQVRYGGTGDLISSFGVSESATSGFDPAFDGFEPPLPPPTPEGDRIRLYFPHPEWDDRLGEKFNRDIQAPLEENEARSWTFEVEQVGSAESVELSWNAITVENHTFALIDVDGQETINMTAQTTYSYTSGDRFRRFRIEVSNIAVEVREGDEAIPTVYALSQNYPNPFNPLTTLRYNLPERVDVVLTIHDLLGREIRTMVRGIEQPGFKAVIWDGTNAQGQPVSSGIYLYRIHAGRFTATRKMVLLR